MKCIVLLFAFAAAASAAVTKREVKLPEYFPVSCPRSLHVEKVNECIKKNMQLVMPHFAKGEKLFGLESLDPIAVSDVRVNLRREPFDFHTVVRNSKVYGVSGILVRGVRANLADDRMTLELDITIPKMLIEGDLKMDGKFGNFPYSGKGPFNVSFTDIVATWRLSGETIEKDGEKYMQLKRFTPEYTVSSMKFYAANLVDGAPELTTLAVNLMNQFWEPVVQVMVPVSNPELERVMKRMANEVFTSIPYDQLFPVV